MAYFIQGEKRPVIFLANYRTASTSTAKALLDNGAEQWGQHHDPVSADQIPENALVVHTVRHHCDVLVSYWYKKASQMAFKDFVEKVLQGCHLYLKPSGFYNHWPVKPNYVLRFETLKLEWETLCLSAGLPDIKLEGSNSKRPQAINWQLLFTPTLFDKVFEIFKTEMEEYGYGRN